MLKSIHLRASSYLRPTYRRPQKICIFADDETGLAAAESAGQVGTRKA